MSLLSRNASQDSFKSDSPQRRFFTKNGPGIQELNLERSLSGFSEASLLFQGENSESQVPILRPTPFDKSYDGEKKKDKADDRQSSSDGDSNTDNSASSARDARSQADRKDRVSHLQAPSSGVPSSSSLAYPNTQPSSGSRQPSSTAKDKESFSERPIFVDTHPSAPARDAEVSDARLAKSAAAAKKVVDDAKQKELAKIEAAKQEELRKKEAARREEAPVVKAYKLSKHIVQQVNKNVDESAQGREAVAERGARDYLSGWQQRLHQDNLKSGDENHAVEDPKLIKAISTQGGDPLLEYLQPYYSPHFPMFDDTSADKYIPAKSSTDMTFDAKFDPKRRDDTINRILDEYHDDKQQRDESRPTSASKHVKNCAGAKSESDKQVVQELISKYKKVLSRKVSRTSKSRVTSPELHLFDEVFVPFEEDSRAKSSSPPTRARDAFPISAESLPPQKIFVTSTETQTDTARRKSDASSIGNANVKGVGSAARRRHMSGSPPRIRATGMISSDADAESHSAAARKSLPRRSKSPRNRPFQKRLRVIFGTSSSSDAQ